MIKYHEVVIQWDDGEEYTVTIAETNPIPETAPEDDDELFYWVLGAPYVGMRLGDATVVAL